MSFIPNFCFQFMILGKKSKNYEVLKINDVILREASEVLLLGVNIDNSIKNIFRKDKKEK